MFNSVITILLAHSKNAFYIQLGPVFVEKKLVTIIVIVKYVNAFYTQFISEVQPDFSYLNFYSDAPIPFQISILKWVFLIIPWARWMGQVACMKEMRNSVGQHEGKKLLERNLGADGQIKLKRILKQGCEGMNWIHVAHDKSPVAGSCEHGNEPTGSIRGRLARSFFQITAPCHNPYI
jgi:hypothetical protein